MDEHSPERDVSDAEQASDTRLPHGQTAPDRSACGAANEDQAPWQALGGAGAREARLILLDRYGSLVLEKAEAIGGSITGPALDSRELVRAGMMALLDAISSFDPARSTDFATFAGPRIQAAMQELALAHETDPDETKSPLRDLRAARARSINDSSRDTAASNQFSRLVDLTLGLAVGHLIEGNAYTKDQSKKSANGERDELSMLAESMKQMVATLDDSDRLLVNLHYDHTLPLPTVGELCGLSTMEVSKRHAQAIQLIRERQLQKGSLSLLC